MSKHTNKSAHRIVRRFIHGELVYVKKEYDDGSVEEYTDNFTADDFAELEAHRREWYCSSDDFDDDEEEDEYWNDDSEERVSNVIRRLLPHSVISTDYEVVETIDGDSFQACALNTSEGRMVRVTGAFVEKSTDDELAYVLAHEIAHHENDDISRRKHASISSVQQITHNLDKLNSGMKEKKCGLIRRCLVVGGAGLLGAARHRSNMLALSRAHESEADKRAVMLMTQAGFDAGAIEDALTKMHGGRLPNQSYWDTFNSTHPNPADRARKARKKLK